MLYDNHIHIINEATTPPEIAAGRWEISRAEMSAIMFVAHLLRGIDWPDELDAAADIVDSVGCYFPRYRRIRQLIALYFMSIPQQVRLIRRMLASNGVAGANVLLIPGTPSEAVDATLAACAGTGLRVYVSWIHADREGVSGIKHYPSLCPSAPLSMISDTACALDLPIISHCSPGGVRDPYISEAKAKGLNTPGRWLDEVRDRPIRLCLAHAGGNKWARWVAGKQLQTWTLDYMMREAHPPTEWAGRLWVDTAFHDDQGTDRYRRAVMRAGAPWRVLWGSDWPLHLPQWSYSQACEWGRAYWGDQVAAYWGDQVAAQAEFSGREG